MRTSYQGMVCAVAASLVAGAAFGQSTITLSGALRDFRGVHANGSNPSALPTHPDFDQFDFGPLLDLQEKAAAGQAGITDVQAFLAANDVPTQYFPETVDNLPPFPPFFPGGSFTIPGALDQTHKVEPGIVGTTLSAGKPSYVGGSGSPPLHKSTSDASNFGAWFNQSAFSLSQPYEMVLKDLGNGLFGFESSSAGDAGTGVGDDGVSDGGFFPLDGKLGGNDGTSREGVDHNYSFTLALNGSITYKAGTGQVFNFTGDDDVWVFVNDKLALDLGGVHQELSASINLDSLASELGLVDGGVYAFNMFYTERNQFASDIKLQTNFFGGGGTEPPTGIPLPAAVWPAMLVLGGMGVLKGARSRRRQLA